MMFSPTTGIYTHKYISSGNKSSENGTYVIYNRRCIKSAVQF